MARALFSLVLIFLPQLLMAQQPTIVNPPTNIQVCPYPDLSPRLCDPLVWVGDHYAVNAYPGWKDYIYLLVEWSNGNVTLARPNFENKGHVALFKGQIAPSGDHIVNGIITGDGIQPQPFTSMWFPRFENADIAKYLATNKPDITHEEAKAEVVDVAGGPSHEVDGITVPSGATDAFAKYPADVRAILLPEHAISKEDAMRPCDDAKEDDPKNTGITDPVLSLEIGRFALRRGEFMRGRCWINHSGILNYNPRAVTIMGVLFMMGWTVQKDPVHAFKFFDSVGFQTHDVWALYFLEQCYAYGYGVEKNLPRASGIDTYLMTHSEGQALFEKIGSDDEKTVKLATAIREAMSPRMKTVTSCYQVGPNSTVPGAPQNKRCEAIEVPDDGK